MLLILFIVLVGFAGAKPANATPFLPHGAKGVFNGASVVFFSYIGFDAVATAAEEVSTGP
jgi:APA family basic amino acid/polyamine antiporter